MSRSMRYVLVLAVLVATGVTAVAGVCDTDREADDDMARIEAFAKDRHEAPSHGSYTWMCVRLQAPRLADRITAACSRILDRDGDHGECIDLLAVLGQAKVGRHDVFEALRRRHLASFGQGGKASYNLYLLGALGDPRAVPVIVHSWKEIEAELEAHPRGDQLEVVADWSSWRQAAAAILGRLARGDDVRGFLAAQAHGADDQYVRRACSDAAKAIAAHRVGDRED